MSSGCWSPRYSWACSQAPTCSASPSPASPSPADSSVVRQPSSTASAHHRRTAPGNPRQDSSRIALAHRLRPRAAHDADPARPRSVRRLLHQGDRPTSSVVAQSPAGRQDQVGPVVGEARTPPPPDLGEYTARAKRGSIRISSHSVAVPTACVAGRRRTGGDVRPRRASRRTRGERPAADPVHFSGARAVFRGTGCASTHGHCR